LHRPDQAQAVLALDPVGFAQQAPEFVGQSHSQRILQGREGGRAGGLLELALRREALNQFTPHRYASNGPREAIVREPGTELHATGAVASPCRRGRPLWLERRLASPAQMPVTNLACSARGRGRSGTPRSPPAYRT